MKIKWKGKNNTAIINIFFYFLFVIVYFYVLVRYGMGTTQGNIRYILLLIAIVFAFLSIFFKYKKDQINKLYGKKLLFIIPLCFVIVVYSFFKAKNIGYNFSYRTLVQTSLILFPSLYVFCFINLFSTKSIVNMMKVTTVILILAYFFEGGHGIFDFFNISNWSSLSFKYSFLESNICSGPFIYLFLLFNYFVESKEYDFDKKRLNIYRIVTLIFSILCFKRLGMLFVIVMFFINRFVNWDKKISNKIFIIVGILFAVVTVLYTKFMEGTLLPQINVYQITTGRNYILSLWKNAEYLSYGYGTSMLVIGRYLEMDLVQMYLEMGFLITLLFCLSFFKIAQNKLYSLVIMTYAFLGLLTASMFPSILSTILLLINISIVSSNKIKDEIYTQDLEKKTYINK